MGKKTPTMKFREAKSDYALNSDTIEKWQEAAGWQNRKLIREWANKKRELQGVKQELKNAKAAVAERLLEEKSEGVKITDKTQALIIDGDETVQDWREQRDALVVDIEELYQVILLYRDMWNASPTIRQGNNVLMKHELEMND